MKIRRGHPGRRRLPLPRPELHLPIDDRTRPRCRRWCRASAWRRRPGVRVLGDITLASVDLDDAGLLATSACGVGSRRSSRTTATRRCGSGSTSCLRRAGPRVRVGLEHRRRRRADDHGERAGHDRRHRHRRRRRDLGRRGGSRRLSGAGAAAMNRISTAGAGVHRRRRARRDQGDERADHRDGLVGHQRHRRRGLDRGGLRRRRRGALDRGRGRLQRGGQRRRRLRSRTPTRGVTATTAR